MMYDYMLSYMDEYFDRVRTVRSKPTGSIEIVRHRSTGREFVFRRFQGMDDVYRRLIAIDCSHLSRVYEAACGNGETLALEEYVRGDTLAFVLQGGLLPTEKAFDIAAQVCDGLWALHSVGAVHRDVKPENIILQGNRAILIDFDASRICKDEQSTDTKVLGTVGYAAPEQFGISQTDARADIYSLGVMLNIMLLGKHPALEIAAGRPGKIIKKCTELNPKDRYQDAAALKAALTRKMPSAHKEQII